MHVQIVSVPSPPIMSTHTSAPVVVGELHHAVEDVLRSDGRSARRRARGTAAPFSAPPAIAMTSAPGRDAELDDRRADRAGAADDQQRLARLQLRPLVHGQVAGVERQGERGRLDVVELGRRVEHAGDGGQRVARRRRRTTGWSWRRPGARSTPRRPAPAASTTPQTSMPIVKGTWPITLATVPRQRAMSPKLSDAADTATSDLAAARARAPGCPGAPAPPGARRAGRLGLLASGLPPGRRLGDGGAY